MDKERPREPRHPCALLREWPLAVAVSVGSAGKDWATLSMERPGLLGAGDSRSQTQGSGASGKPEHRCKYRVRQKQGLLEYGW